MFYLFIYFPFLLLPKKVTKETRFIQLVSPRMCCVCIWWMKLIPHYTYTWRHVLSVFNSCSFRFLKKHTYHGPLPLDMLINPLHKRDLSIASSRIHVALRKPIIISVLCSYRPHAHARTPLLLTPAPVTTHKVQHVHRWCIIPPACDHPLRAWLQIYPSLTPAAPLCSSRQ